MIAGEKQFLQGVHLFQQVYRGMHMSQINEYNFKTYDVNIQIENTTENFKKEWKYLLIR